MRIASHLFNLIASCAILAFAYPDGLLVPTAQGPVQGKLISPNVRQFLGIPYATARRWEAPVLPPIRPQSQPFQALNFSDTCPRTLNAFTMRMWHLVGLNDSDIFRTESEDCLSVNVWAPSVQRQQKTSVLLFVYGGSFQEGTSDSALYEGSNIVENNDDVLVVTFNYRVNIFGFPNADSSQLPNDGSKSQNYGLLDIDAAVQWVYDNIRQFGGDPERITLFGQSAGAMSIDAYTFANPHDTRVKAVVLDSGTLEAEHALLPGPTQVIDSWGTVSRAVGCGRVTGAAQVECMKKVPFDVLEKALIDAEFVMFAPVADGITFFSARETLARSQAGNFLRVPLLLGSSQHEADVIVVAAKVTAGIAIQRLGYILSDMLTMFAFTCSVRSTALYRVKAGVPTWRYKYQGEFPNISLRPDLRAYHGAQLPIIFGTYPRPGTQNQEDLSRFVQKTFVAFARDPKFGLSLLKFGWPRYVPDTFSMAEIGGSLKPTGIKLANEPPPVGAMCKVIKDAMMVINDVPTGAPEFEDTEDVVSMSGIEQVLLSQNL